MQWALKWIGSGRKIVDLGCHKGDITAILRDAGNNVVGVDYPSLIQKAAEEKGLVVIAHDLNNPLPFSDNEFDSALAISILDYLPNDLAFLKECRRIVKPGGIMVVGVPNAVSLYNRAAALLGRSGRNFSDPTGYHTLHYYTVQGISRLLELAGFKVEAIKKAPKATSKIPLRKTIEQILPATFSTDILIKAI